jgi:hypothetical protein
MVEVKEIQRERNGVAEMRATRRNHAQKDGDQPSLVSRRRIQSAAPRQHIGLELSMRIRASTSMSIA